MNNNACPAPDVLAAFASGELDAQSLSPVQAHVSDCDACLEMVGHLTSKVSRSECGELMHPTLAEAGQQIGPYRLLRRVGEGGMGEVWEAQQLAPVRRVVALKLLKAGMDTRQIVARFEAERQMLALMQHPGIAQVFDAGITDAGRPYFVMEYVDGARITSYCDRANLGVPERLKLFQQVCDAVQHAHQKGVIHRDLKPSNVLVTTHASGALPKVIDFGLAKATTSEVKDASLTEFGTMLGTPAYASPEQMSFGAVDIDTRSDVYSLGVLLYELLVGVIPFEANSAEPGDVIDLHRAIREREPTRPSARVSRLGDRVSGIAQARGLDAQALRRQLRGDLDWIVMKALEKDRELRYASVHELSMDVQRYLRHEPLQAGPPTTTYRVRKFVRRHRVGTAFAAVLAGIVVTFVIVTIMQAQRIAAERDRATAAAENAELRRGQAEGLIGFMLGDLREKLEPIGKLDVLDAVGDQAMRYFEVLGDRGTETEMLARAKALRQIGEVRFGQGRLEPALESFMESQRVLERLHTKAPANNEYLFELAQSEFWIGYVAWERKDFAGAERRMTRYMERSRALYQREPTHRAYQTEVANAYSNLGSVVRERGDRQAALQHFERSIALRRRLIDADPRDSDAVVELANGLSWIGRTLMELGRLQASEDSFRSAMAAIEPLQTLDRDLAHSELYGQILLWLGDVHLQQGDVARAGQLANTSYQVMQRLTAHDPGNAYWKYLANQSAYLRAVVLAARGQLEQSSALIERTAVDAAALARESPSTDHFNQQVLIANLQTELALARGDAMMALRLAREATQHLQRTLQSGAANEWQQPFGAMTHETLGRAAVAAGLAEEARQTWRTALALLRDVNDGDLRLLAVRQRLLTDLGQVQEAQLLSARLAAGGFRDPRYQELTVSHGRIALREDQ